MLFSDKHPYYDSYQKYLYAQYDVHNDLIRVLLKLDVINPSTYNLMIKNYITHPNDIYTTVKVLFDKK